MTTTELKVLLLLFISAKVQQPEVLDKSYKISFASLIIVPELRLTYDGRLIYCEKCRAFLSYDSLVK